MRAALHLPLAPQFPRAAPPLSSANALPQLPTNAQVSSRTRASRLRVRLETCAFEGIRGRGSPQSGGGEGRQNASAAKKGRMGVSSPVLIQNMPKFIAKSDLSCTVFSALLGCPGR